jgi:O-acetyl-ADP-ribose deacetylase (regulator of RNase III)
VAFPSISTGAYGFPLERAAKIALQSIMSVVAKRRGLREVTMVLFSEQDLAVYERVLKELTGPEKP